MNTVLQELYTQQVKNINEHFIAMQTYDLFGDFELMKKTHRKQLDEEIGNTLDLCLVMLERTREVIDILDIKKPTMLVTERPPSKLKRMELHKTMLQSWEQWEEAIIPLYENAIKEYPDCKLLKTLKRKAESEVKYIQKLLGCL